jgi:uncharacterized Zn-binding protein involved in type VI secretion
MPLAAKENDTIFGTDTHRVMVPAGTGTVPTPLPGHVFDAPLSAGLSNDVLIQGKKAAVVGSKAFTNLARHMPMAPGVSYEKPPNFQGEITRGSTTVFINGKAAARAGDPALTCSDVPLPPQGTSIVRVTSSSVSIG